MKHQENTGIDLGSGRSEDQLTGQKLNLKKPASNNREEVLAATLLDALDLGEVMS
jgi:hypothetical protein